MTPAAKKEAVELENYYQSVLFPKQQESRQVIDRIQELSDIYYDKIYFGR